jgi:aryl sulfotransferase
MRAGHAAVVPNAGAVLKDPAAFFRRGRSGAGREVLDAVHLEHYANRVRSCAPADMLAWLHRPDRL